jgi:hypothetical protein
MLFLFRSSYLSIKRFSLRAATSGSADNLRPFFVIAASRAASNAVEPTSVVFADNSVPAKSLAAFLAAPPC